MKLIDLLVQELPKRGGWPDGVNRINQAYDGRLEDYRKDGDSYSLKINEVLPLTCNHRGEAEYVHESGADFVTREQYESALAAAQQPVWNGEGLPPVGCQCEIGVSTPYLNIPHPEGAVVKIYSHFTDDRGVELAAFVDAAGKVGGVCTSLCFRPIRSEAERKRDEALNAMAAYCTPEDLCTAIFAGKIPHIQLK